MPIFTKIQLLTALDPNYKDEGEAELAIVNLENSGPGEFDSWLHLEGHANCFRKKESAIRGTQKNKLILSTQLWSRIRDERNYAILAALCTHFEIYLWPGNQRSFNTVIPIKDV